MKQLSNPSSVKRPDYRAPDVDYSQIHRLKDGPPYDTLYVTGHGIEALRTQSEKFRADYRRNAPESDYNTSKSYGNRIPGEKDVNTGYGREYTRESSYNAYGREYTRETSYNEEDINTEAEEFIQVEHQKLNVGRGMSTDSFNYY